MRREEVKGWVENREGLRFVKEIGEGKHNEGVEHTIRMKTKDIQVLLVWFLEW